MIECLRVYPVLRTVGPGPLAACHVYNEDKEAAHAAV
jgi:hypothetical protein